MTGKRSYFLRNSSRHWAFTSTSSRNLSRWKAGRNCAMTFLYLESYRVQQMARRDLSDEEKRWWKHQRTYWPVPGGPFGDRAKGIAVHRRLPRNPRRDAQTETHHPRQFPQGIPGRVVNSVKNSATSKLARRVNMACVQHQRKPLQSPPGPGQSPRQRSSPRPARRTATASAMPPATAPSRPGS